MTITVSFTIPGKISGKGRARSFVTGKGYLKSYTPENTRNAEALIRDLAAQAMKGLAVFTGPVEMHIEVWRLIPPSWTKKRRAAAKFVTGKPDADNILKLISDSANRVIFFDDAQVAVARIQRRYSETREEVYVLVRTLDEGSLEQPEPKPTGLRLVDNGTSETRQNHVVGRSEGSRDRPPAASDQPANGQQKGAT